MSARNGQPGEIFVLVANGITMRQHADLWANPMQPQKTKEKANACALNTTMHYPAINAL